MAIVFDLGNLLVPLLGSRRLDELANLSVNCDIDRSTVNAVTKLNLRLGHSLGEHRRVRE